MVVAVSQIVLIPILIFTWGLDGFGTWMVLIAIPQFLTITDLGFSYSAKADMAIRVKRGEILDAQITASSVAGLLAIFLMALLLLFIPIILNIDLVSALNLSDMENYQAAIVLVMGFLYLASYQIFLLHCAVIRASGRPTTEVFLNAIFRAIDATAIGLGALAGGSIATVGIIWAISRALTTTATVFWLKRAEPELIPDLSQISMIRLRELLSPSIAFMVFPLSNALSLQGMTLLVGVTFGGTAVAQYVALRTVTRLGVSILNVLNYSFTPQYSYFFGDRNYSELSRYFSFHILLAIVCSVVYLFVILSVGRLFVSLLTQGGSYTFDSSLFALFVVASLLEMFWTPFLSYASGKNAVQHLAKAHAIFTAFSIILALSLIKIIGLHGPVLAIATAQLFTLITALWLQRSNWK